MRPDVAANNAVAKLCMPSLRTILAPHVVRIEDATVEQDTRQATDLVVVSAGDIRVACRVRRPGYADHPLYRWQFTVRSRVPSGTETELTKIFRGWGDRMIYAHQREHGSPQIARWTLVDLRAFRGLLQADEYRARCGRDRFLCDEDISNGDGTWFRAYDVREIPQVVIASSYEIPAVSIPRPVQPDFFLVAV